MSAHTVLQDHQALRRRASASILRLAEANYSYWWMILFPSLAMFFTVTVFNLVGSGLRDAMDPRLRI